MTNRWLKRAAAVWLGLALQTAGATADPLRDSVIGALDLCADLPPSVIQARAKLSDLGWERNDEALLFVLINQAFFGQFDATNVEDTLRHAYFKAMSVLGNSPLGPEQVGASLDGFDIGITGIAEGSPSCAISGPERLENIVNHSPFSPNLIGQRSTTMKQLMGVFDDQVTAIASFEPGQCELTINQLDLPQEAKDELFDTLRPVVFMMLPMETIQ